MDSTGLMIHDVITLVRHGLLETARKFEERDGRLSRKDMVVSIIKELGSLNKVVALVTLENNADWAHLLAVTHGDALTTRQKDALVAIVAETHEVWYANRFACDTRGNLTARQLDPLIAIVVKAKRSDIARSLVCDLGARKRLAKRHVDALISIVVEGKNTEAAYSIACEKYLTEEQRNTLIALFTEKECAAYAKTLLSKCLFLTEKQKKLLEATLAKAA